MEYIIEDNRIILINGTSIQTLWFVDMKSCIISGTDIFFSMTWGNEMVNLGTITKYNGGSCIPPNMTIYNETSNAISSFEGYCGTSSSCSPYRVISDRDPLPTDDISLGFTPTVQWLNTTGNKDLFECVSNAAGAAVWNKIQYVNL